MSWRRDGRQVSDHLCECECGEYTLIAVATDPRWGHIKGEPMRYLHGHGADDQFKRLHFRESRVSEDGLCYCGCGEITPVATRNNHRYGHVKGQHIPYISGHNTGRKLGIGITYFIGADEGPVKIGWTTTPARRLAEFQTAHWAELHMLGQVSSTADMELRCHRELREHRVRGEWFEREPALALLAELAAVNRR
jgi:hypothetical protein